jgi:thiamine biosynthesis lipoprotein ApbE
MSLKPITWLIWQPLIFLPIDILSKKSTISLDLASIAKGFAVDQITRLIRNDEKKLSGRNRR